jgi:hypothetical protein
MVRSSRESDAKKDGRRRGCIEHDFAKGFEIRASTGTEAVVIEMGVSVRSSTATKKSGEVMA